MGELISVIVPVYNMERFLKRCVDSIFAQTYENIEIILVDDGSTDASGTLCDRLAEQDARVRVIHQPNAGVSTARNAGMQAAGGAYFAFCDSDDIMLPDMLQKLYSLLLAHRAGVASCEFRRERAEDAPRDDRTIEFDAQGAVLDMLCNQNVNYAVTCKLFSKAAIGKIRFQTQYSHNEDMLFCYEAFLAGGAVVHTTEELYIYCDNETSATRVPFHHKRMTAIDVQEWVLQDILKRFSDPAYTKTAEQQFLKVNIYTAMQMARDDYQNKADFDRVRGNIRVRLKKLLRGDLSRGYKIYGFLAVKMPKLFWRLSKKKK